MSNLLEIKSSYLILSFLNTLQKRKDEKDEILSAALIKQEVHLMFVFIGLINFVFSLILFNLNIKFTVIYYYI